MPTSNNSGEPSFADLFKSLTGFAPFPWQERLYDKFAEGIIPKACDLPTGLGKTSVVAVWLVAKLRHPEKVPTRLVYVVNRRTVVDQTTTEVEKYRKVLGSAEFQERHPGHITDLPISTLRGQFADNRQWCEDPSRPAVIVGTVDMIGSRLLFSGYGIGFKSRPLHAGLLGQDSLIVHDEAHLEPAFQTLLEAIEAEQQRERKTFSPPWRAMQVMELSATRRGEKQSFELEKADWSHEEIKKRTGAVKQLTIHEVADEKKIVDQVAEEALKLEATKKAILVFARGVDDVAKIATKLNKKHANSVAMLTGTMRGYERDKQMDPRREGACRVFARFLRPPKEDAPESEKWKITPAERTVYLVCTSAGEVGVNISADHLVCDLTTFESMAQRFGRVNRFGNCPDTQIRVFAPTGFDEKDEAERRREATLKLLRELDGDAAPKSLSKLDASQRAKAFSPAPIILDTSDILFDAWALTTIKDKLPGRPPVADYLHGKSEAEPPQTRVAWREEVELSDDAIEKIGPEALLEDFPLKPHELLTSTTRRVEAALDEMIERLTKQSSDAEELRAWVVDDLGDVTIHRLSELIEKDRQKNRVVDLEYCTLILPPAAGGLAGGMLEGDADKSRADKHDVSCEWSDEEGNRRRMRYNSLEEAVKSGMRIIRKIDRKPNADDTANGDGLDNRYWYWCEQRDQGDTDRSRGNLDAVTLSQHVEDVRANANYLVRQLGMKSPLREALQHAADWHDLGKMRNLWQAMIGRPPDKRGEWYAKSDKKWVSLLTDSYRHELGSLIDLAKKDDCKAVEQEVLDIAFHMIATHHGYGRPHFPVEMVFDPENPDTRASETAIEVTRRFAKLQRKYGRWGLAYLESLLRAADYAASAKILLEKEITR